MTVQESIGASWRAKTSAHGNDRQHLMPELMDDLELNRTQAEQALADLDRVHRHLFGFWATRRTLLPLIALAGPNQWLLDIGSGSGSPSADLVEQSSGRGVRLRVVELDRKLSHLLISRARCISGPQVVADASALPFRTGAVTWSFQNLLLHHLRTDQARLAIAEMCRVAHQGAVVVDLRRSLWARWLLRPAARLLGLGRIARHDGLLSIAQSWSRPELLALTKGRPIALRRRFPFRWSLFLPH